MFLRGSSCATSELCLTSDLDPVTFDINIHFYLDIVIFALEILFSTEGYAAMRYVVSFLIDCKVTILIKLAFTDCR